METRGDTKYRYVMQTVKHSNAGRQVTVRARLTGAFPGALLNWTTSSNFNDKIASLELIMTIHILSLFREMSLRQAVLVTGGTKGMGQAMCAVLL